MVIITSKIGQHDLYVLREKVKAFLVTELQGKEISIKSQLLDDCPFSVFISNNSIDKLLSSGGPNKMACLMQLEEIISDGEFLKKEDPKEKNKQSEKTFWWFKTIVQIDGEIFEFLFSVKEYKSSHKKVYSGHIDMKKPLR